MLLKRLIASGLALGLALTLAGGVLAAKPYSELRNDRFSTSFVDSFTCPSQDILSEAAIKRTWTSFYDGGGNETRFVAQAVYRLTFTDLQSGISIDGQGTRHIVFDFVAGTYTDVGAFRALTARGVGSVLRQAGRLVEDLDTEELISMAGPHQDYLGDYDAFCSALAG